jgi:hypothetical protein
MNAPLDVVRRRRLLALLIATAVLAGTLGAASAQPAAAAPCIPFGCVPPITDAFKAIPGVDAVVDLVGSVGGAVGGAVASVAKGVLDAIGQGVAAALGALFGEVSQFFTDSSSPRVTVASFVGEDGAYHRVAQLSVLLMILFLFLAVVQGVVAGDPLGMIGRALRNVPLAVLAVFGFPWAVDQLVGLVDAMCASLLPTGDLLGTIARVYVIDQIRFGLVSILILLFAFVACVLIYAELVARAAVVTLVVALAPLSFAALVWPAARGAGRKVVELVVALVLSKLAIWVALVVGIELFESHARAVVPGGQAMGQMIAGAAVLAVAVFAPFVVWRLIPVAEAAGVTSGLSRMPSRAAMTAAHTATTLRSLGVGGRGGKGDGGRQHPALADLPARSLGTTEGTGGSPSSGPGPGSSGNSGGGRTLAAGEAAGGGAAGAGLTTAAGTAGAAVAPVAAAGQVAHAGRDRVVASSDAQSRSAGRPASEGWSFRDERGGT